MGMVSEEMGKRKGTMLDMTQDNNNNTRLIYKISSQNLLGIRNNLLTKTRGTAIMSSYFLGYEPKGSKMETNRSGALIATQGGTTLSYGISSAQDRGKLFVSPQQEVYAGQVVGIASKEMDVEVNVCKAKQLTNNRSSGEGVNISVEPATPLSLEQALDFINDDELLEVTPLNIRVRKLYLTEAERRIHNRKNNS
jgi:GTP-binding protein